MYLNRLEASLSLTVPYLSIAVGSSGPDSALDKEESVVFSAGNLVDGESLESKELSGLSNSVEVLKRI